MELKNRVVSGFVWHSIERFSVTVFQTCVSIILARIIGPEEFGLIPMLIVFSAIAGSIVDSGFSQALMRKQNPSQQEYTSIFYINIGVSVIMYLALLALARPIANFYEVPELVDIAPYMFLILPINALGIVQNTLIVKQMKFKLSAQLNLIAALVSGILAVWMAYNGYGAWAIVWQMVSVNAIRVLLMWMWNRWVPLKTFSLSAVKELFNFGSKLFISGIITQVSNNISQLLIGKVYNPTQLGLYYQSQKLKDTFFNTISYTILNVSLPAFVELQDDQEKLKEAMRKIVAVLSFLIFPVMAGLIAIAEDFFAIILQDKWLPAVPYFKLFCISAIFIPTMIVSYNILRAKGLGKLIMNIEITKRLFSLAIIFITINISIMAIIWGMLIYTAQDALLNYWYTRKHIGYKFRELMHDTLPYLAISAVMYIGVISLNLTTQWVSPIWILVLKVVVGVALYLGISALVKPEAWNESYSICKKMLHKQKDNQQN